MGCGSSFPIRVSIALITASLLPTTCCICACSFALWQASSRSSRRLVLQAKKTAKPRVTIMAAPCFCRKLSNQVSAIVFMSVTPGGGVNGVSSTAECVVGGGERFGLFFLRLFGGLFFGFFGRCFRLRCFLVRNAAFDYDPGQQSINTLLQLGSTLF